MRKVFVAYDFASGGTLPTDLQTLSEHQLPDLEVDLSGGASLESPGELWEQKVRSGIDGCDRLGAFADLPNANVGFEIGYALSRKKEVGIAYSRSTPHRWLKRPPFRGEFVQRLENVDEIYDFLRLEQWPGTEHSVKGGGQSVLFLCPPKSGAAFRKFRDRSWLLPDQERWNLRSLSKVFEGVGLVVWVVSPHNEGESGRDGPENAALSILAGFAEGHLGLDLLVLRSGDAREVADVASHEHGFQTIDQFKNLILLINAGWGAVDRPTDLPFREWLPTLANTPAFASVDCGLEKPELSSTTDQPAVSATNQVAMPPKTPTLRKAIVATLVMALGFIALGSIDYFDRCPSKIVFSNEMKPGILVRLKADNFDTTVKLEARVGDMGNLKIDVPECQIRDEFRDTDKAPKVYLEVLEPANLVFENYSWDENENYRSESPWPIPHDRNRISTRLITKGEWDQNRFEAATDEVSRHLADLSREERAKLVETILNKSNLSLAALRKSVSEKEIAGVRLEDTMQKVDAGKIVAESAASGRTEPLSAVEKEALAAVVASTGALIRTSGRNPNDRLPASGLVVGDHFVFTSPRVLPLGFVTEKLPATLPRGSALQFSLAERVEEDRAPLPVQDIVAIQPEYIVLMVPNAGLRVRRSLEKYYKASRIDKMLSKDFVFLTPGERDEKCVAIGYPVATAATPSQFQGLLAMPTKSGFQPRKRISVGRIYTSNPVWSTHTARTMDGAYGGPVAYVNDNEVGIVGFNRGGMWLGEGYQLNATYHPDPSSTGSWQAKDLVKHLLVAYASREIEQLPTALQSEASLWRDYFKPEIGTYELRKKLAELRTTAWSFEHSRNGPESYRLFRAGWLEFRAAEGRKQAHFMRSIDIFEYLLKNDPQYFLAWLRLGEAYDKTRQRIKSYRTLKKGFQVFKHQLSQSPVETSVWEREIEASFLNTLFLVCDILSKYEEDPESNSVYSREQFELEAAKYFKLLEQVCPYHPTLVGEES